MQKQNKYKNMTSQELLSQLSRDIWNGLTLNEQTKILTELTLKIKEKICNTPIDYMGKHILVNPKGFVNYDITVKMLPLEGTVYGRYDQNNHTLMINANIFHRNSNINIETSLFQLPYVLAHEVKHAFQDYVIEDCNIFTKDYVNLLQSYRDKTEIQINCFDISRKGNLHINPITDEQFNENTYIHNIDGNKSIIKNLANMCYYLNVVERESFIFGEEQGNEFIQCNNNGNVDSIQIGKSYNKTNKQLNLFRERYCCPKYSDEKILSIIDDCFNIIANSDGNIENILKSNIEKLDDLKANIIYDIACISMFYENNEIKNEQTRKNNGDKIIELLDENQKTKNLYNCGYASTNAISKYNARCDEYIIIPTIERTKHFLYSDLNSFESLSDEDKKNNPLLVLTAATELKEKILDYIDINAVKAYCRNNIDEVLDGSIYQKGLGIIDKNFLNQLLITKENNITQKENNNNVDEISNELNVENLIENENTEKETIDDTTQVYNREYAKTDDTNNYCFYQEYDGLENDDMEL